MIRFNPRHKVFLCSGALPNISDDSFYEKILDIRFHETFSTNSKGNRVIQQSDIMELAGPRLLVVGEEKSRTFSPEIIKSLTGGL